MSYSIVSLACLYLVLTLISCKSPTVSTENGAGYLSLPQTELYYWTIGSGEPIVILHGGPGMDHSYLLPQMEILKEDHQLIFFDQRACGKSSFGMDSSLISMIQFVEDIEAFRKHFQLEKINLMGHSWGGLLAMWYATIYPQHLNSLILVNSIGANKNYTQEAQQIAQSRFSPEEQLQLMALMRSDAFQAGADSAVLAAFRLSFLPTFYKKDLLNELSLNLASNRKERQAKLMHLMKDLVNYNLLEDLKKVQAPTLIIHGDYDATPLNALKEIEEVLPHAQLEVIKECGHFAYIEAPEKFRNLVLDFLKSN